MTKVLSSLSAMRQSVWWCGGSNTTYKSSQLISIQYLRAAAAIMVIMVHLMGHLRRLGYVGPWPEWMTAGVDIFFVISGFVMWMTTRARPCGMATFYWNRLVRIVPLYWMLTSVVTLITLLVPSVVLSGRLEWHHVIMSYLFLPAINPVGGLIQPVLEPGWTLNYEMYFYVIFGALLFLPGHLLLLAVTAWLIATAYVGAMGLTDHFLVGFFGSGIVLDFGFGVLLGATFIRGWVLPSSLALLSIVLGFGTLAVHGLIDAPHWFVIGIPALAIVAGAIALERRHNLLKVGFLLLLGDASYSLYLSHGIVFSACLQATRRLGLSKLPLGNLIFAAASCLIVAIVGIVIHLKMEKPFTEFLKTRRYAKIERKSLATISQETVVSLPL